MKELSNVNNSHTIGRNLKGSVADKATATRPLRVLMICTGNICRSTMAEQVLRESAKRAGLGHLVEVDSAGISDEEHGRAVDPRAARALAEAGYGVPTHRARQVSAAELGRWDLVLAMTSGHLNALKRLAMAGGVEVCKYPAGSANIATGLAGLAGVPAQSGTSAATHLPTMPVSLKRVSLHRFRDFDPKGTGDVPDPWYGTYEDFVDTLAVIERVIPVLLDRLQAISID